MHDAAVVKVVRVRVYNDVILIIILIIAVGGLERTVLTHMLDPGGSKFN